MWSSATGAISLAARILLMISNTFSFIIIRFLNTDAQILEIPL